MSTAPQLQLSIQPSTTSFKRSFEQFGVDLGSPVGASNPDTSTTNDRNGNDRNKRARNSITSISEESTGSSSSLTDLTVPNSQSSTSPSSSSSSSSVPDDETAQVLGLTDDSTPVISLRTSVIPPRLPTPDIQDVDMPDYPHQEADLEPGNASNTTSLSPLDLLAQHDLQPSSSSTASSPAVSRAQPDTQDQYRISLERFNAFDSEIAVLRLPIDPVPSARTRVHRRSPTPPPTLPPIALSAEQEPLAPFLGDNATANSREESSQSSMNLRVRYQPDRRVYRPLQLHQNHDEDEEEEAEDEHDDGESDSDGPTSRIQSRIHEAFREHLDSALDRLRSGSPLVPDLEREQEDEDDEETGSTIPPHPPTLPPIVMDGLEPLLDDSESQQPQAESTSQARSDSGTITPRVAPTSTPIIRTISNPSLDDHRLPSPLLRELHNWMDEDDIEEGPSTTTDFLVGPFSRTSDLQSRSTYVGLPQLDVGGGLDLGLEDNETSHRAAQSNAHTHTRASLEAQPSRSPTSAIHRNRSSHLIQLGRITFDTDTDTLPSTSSPFHNFRNRPRRFQSSASLVSEALAEARARREMEEIRATRFERTFREGAIDTAPLTRERSASGSTWRSRRLSLLRDPESPLFSASDEFYFDDNDFGSATGRRSQDWHRRMGREERVERVEREREREQDSERGMGGWIALGIGMFGDSRDIRSGHGVRSESRQRVGEASSSRSASTFRLNAPPSSTGRDHDENRDDEGSSSQSRDTLSISTDFRTELSMLRETMAGLTRTLETAVGASATHSSNSPESNRIPQPPTRRPMTSLLAREGRSEADPLYRRRQRYRNGVAERRHSRSPPPPRPLSPDDGASFFDLLEMIDDSVAATEASSRNVRSRTSRSSQLGFGTTFVESAVEGEGADEEHASRDRQASPGPGGRSARGIVISDLDSHNGAILDSRLDMNIALGVGAAPAAPSTRPSISASMTSRPSRFSWMGGRRRDRSFTDLLSGILPSSPTSPSSAISHSPLTSSSTSLHLPASSFLDEPLHRHRSLAEEDESDMDVDYEMGMDAMDTSASFDRPSVPTISQPSLHERVPFNTDFARLSDSGFGLRSPPSPIEFRRHSSHSSPGEVSEANSHSTLDTSSDGIGSTDVSHSHHTHNHNHSTQYHIASTSPPQPPSLPAPDLGRPLSSTHIPSSIDNSYRVVDEPERVDAGRRSGLSAIHTASNPYARVSNDSGFVYQNLSTPPLPPTPTPAGNYQEYGLPYFVSGPPHLSPLPHPAAEVYDGRETDGGNPDGLRYRTRTIPVPRHPQYMADNHEPPSPVRTTDSPFLRSERLPLPPRPSGNSWHRSQHTRPTLPSVFGNTHVDPSTFAPGPFRNTVEHMMTERGGYHRSHVQRGRTQYHPPAPTIPPIVFDNNSYDTPSRSRADDTPTSSSSHTRSSSAAEPADRLGNLRRSINEFEHRIFHRPPLSSTSTSSSFASARGAALLNQEANNSASNLHSYVPFHHHHHPHSNSSTAVNQQQQSTNTWSGDSTSTIRPLPLPRPYPRPYTSSASDMHRLLTERVRMDGSRLENPSQPLPHFARLPHPAELGGTLRNPTSSSEGRPEPGSDSRGPQHLADRYRRMYEPQMGASYRDRRQEQMGGASGSQRTGEDNRETVTPRSASRWMSGSGSDDSSSINNGDSHVSDFMTAMRGRRARFPRPEGMSLFGRRRSRQALGDYMVSSFYKYHNSFSQ
ncbi:hypothetical protein BJ165DRAFT_1480578 [Panaeolus papilionaceus]|nr:hypothetical protein BJ165DRAFT_1480578 [Panaeolus papilionaceus]